jgi:hypothetical protein
MVQLNTKGRLIMNDKNLWKPWVSSLTGFTFSIVAFSGVLMLLHVHLPYMKSFHEWVGLLFTCTAVIHLVIHWRSLMEYLKRRAGMVSLVIVVLLCATLMALGGGEGERGMHGPQDGRPGVEHRD